MCVALSAASASPYAVSIFSYTPGGLTESPPDSGLFYNDPNQALGAPDPWAANDEPTSQVVQLGQGGSIVLGFDTRVYNKPAGVSASNPLGVDFVIFGNAFERGVGTWYTEPGFVEVAKKKGDGTPDIFYLILPSKLPPLLVGEVDTGQVTTLMDGYADVHPVIGSGDHMIGPDQVGSAGGDPFRLERAVLQSSPGVPALDGNNQPQFVSLDWIDFVRITDPISDDVLHGIGGVVVGGITTDIDAVVALPNVPEPGMMAPILVLAAVVLKRRK